MIITSKDNEIIKHAAKLVKSSKYRREQGLFTAEGTRICLDGVQSGYSPEIFFCTEKSREKHMDDFEKISAVSRKTVIVSQSVFEKLSDTKSPQGFFCVFNILDKNKNLLTINTKGNYIALENIQDPSNLGTILRTAEALGFNGVLMSENCCDLYSPKVVRGSMGAVFRLPCFVPDDFISCISDLTSSGIITYGSTPRDAEDITKLSLSGGVMLIGNEGNGLSEAVLNVCAQRVKIPMSGRAESLNAAAAAAILMWELVR